jgi:hypothetical protein
VIADGPVGEVEAVSENGSLDPATVRPRLAEAAAEGLEGIRKTLLDAATGAVRDHWITFECGECGARERVEVPVPDVRARVAAIELLLREGLGRPAVAEEPPVLRLPTTAEAVEAMPWSDMRAPFVSLFVDEIARVRQIRGDAHLRGRVMSLSPDDRNALRAAGYRRDELIQIIEEVSDPQPRDTRWRRSHEEPHRRLAERRRGARPRVRSPRGDRSILTRTADRSPSRTPALGHPVTSAGVKEHTRVNSTIKTCRSGVVRRLMPRPGMSPV